MTPTPTVPRAAAWLGGLGLVPFAGLSAGLLFLADEQHVFAARALLAYGAVILSFLGGVQWGMAILASSAALWGRLSLSVLPSLLGWVALLLPVRDGLLLLVLSLALALLGDLRAVRLGFAPAWYGRLRLPLSGAVMASLFAAAWW